MNPIIISAPFGNWIRPKGCTLTLGTFTANYRAGVLKRLWRMAVALRPIPRAKAWINKMGLPNPGIHSIYFDWLKNNDYFNNKIISIHGFNTIEWGGLIDYTASYHPLAIELNISCPNVEPTTSREILDLAKIVEKHKDTTFIAKLPPIRWMEAAKPMADAGIAWFHACNTIWTPGGGISGKPLMPYSLWAVEELRRAFPDSKIIGGGGIKLKRYLSLSRRWCRPLRHW